MVTLKGVPAVGVPVAGITWKDVRIGATTLKDCS